MLSAPSQGFERAALGVDGAIGIALAELAFGIAHGFAGTAKLVHLALPLLALPEPAFAQLFHQFLELIAQGLLAFPQLSHLIAGLTLLALLSVLSLLSALPALAVAALVLALLKGAVAQLLLLADHVAELVQRRR